ncbi:MAG: TrmH family RNA methyltransferase [Rhabdochlamydiaceae bacterium]
MMKEITSLQNQKIKEAASLYDRKFREANSLFLIEGYREIKRALSRGVNIKRVFFHPSSFLNEERSLLDQLIALTNEYYQVPQDLLKKICYREKTESIVVVAKKDKDDWNSIYKKGSSSLLVVAEEIEKPGNLGAMLRSCDGAGADGFILNSSQTDVYNPNVIRASAGAVFGLPVIQADKEQTYDWLKKNHISVLATTPKASHCYTDVDLAAPVAFVMGTEDKGLSSFWLEVSDIQVKIPMYGLGDSLNVASATTLLLYEARRQRRVSGYSV